MYRDDLERAQWRTERLRAEATVERLLRAAGTDPSRSGRSRRVVAALARTTATRLTRFADAVDGRRRTVST
jgi:hypothetical protein